MAASSSTDEVTPGLLDWTRVAPDDEARFAATGAWTDETWCQSFAAWANERPADVAVIDENVSKSVGEIWDAASRLAAHLRSVGVRRGEVVSVIIPNWWEFAVAHAAVSALGAVCNPLLPSLGWADVAHVLKTARSVAVIAAREVRGADLIGRLEPALASVDRSMPLVEVRGSGESDLTEILARTEPLSGLPVTMSGADPDTVLFTSGTESVPKGVVHQHRSSQFSLRTYIDQVLRLPEGTSVFMPSPICHATGLQWGLRAAGHVRGPLVLLDRWDPAVAADLVRNHGCGYTLGATPFISELADEWARRDWSGTSPLTSIVSGGASIPRHLVERCRAVFGSPLLAVFGASETYVATATRHDSTDGILVSDGQAIPGVEVAIVDGDGVLVPVGVEGEIVTRGPHVFAGYLGPADLTKRAFRGSWYRFGDLGTLDADGALRVTGRVKDVVIRGGQNISVAEVENHLAKHPAVLEIAIVGVPDDRLGERCCAVVVPHSGADVALADLTSYLIGEGVAKYKLPERLEVLPELPRTATGKVQKAQLRERFAT